MSSLLFPEKVGWEKGAPCRFAEDYYCQGCGRCEHEYDLRTEEEIAMDEIAENIYFLDLVTDCMENPEDIADAVVKLIALNVQLEMMLNTYQNSNVGNS